MTSSENLTVFIIEDDALMAECLARAVAHAFSSRSTSSRQTSTPRQVVPVIKTFPDAVSVTAALADSLPNLILLDVLLNGPDGFTFLNEIISYSDTAQIPVILVTSLNLADRNLEHYGVRAILNKDTMTPADIQEAVRAALIRNNASTSKTAPTQSATFATGVKNAR